MPIERNRSTRRILAATIALTPVVVTSAALAQAAGTERSVSGVMPSDAGLNAPLAPPASDEASAGLARAKEFADSGRLVRAKGVLGDLLASAAIENATSTVRTDVLELLQSVENRLANADALDVSLQRAEIAIENGDFLEAERHARAVLNKRTAVGSQRSQAQELLGTVEQRRNDLAPMVVNAIEQVRQDFAAGRYAQAKGAIMAVKGTGIALNEEQAQVVSRFQYRILEVEAAQGRIFPTDEVGLAVFQPGVVRRDRPAGSEPAPTPDNSNVTPAPGNDLAVAPVAQPAEQPAEQPATPAWRPSDQPTPTTPASPTTQPPAQDDIIRQALRLDAQSILAEADKLFAEGRYNLAQEKYAKVVAAYRQYLSAEEISSAESKLAEARIKMDQGSPRTDIIEQITLVRDATRAEFQNAMSEAERALAAGDSARARDLAAGARLTFSRNRDAFNPQEQNEEFITPLNEMSQRIESEEAAIQQRELEARTRGIEEQAAEREATARTAKARMINEAVDRARALQQEQKYRAALEVVDQILFLDERNPTALLLRETLRDIVIFQDYWAIQREKQFKHAEATLDNERAMIFPDGIYDYPKDWPAKSHDRGDYGAFADSPENKQTLAKLDKRIPVQFRDNSVADILKYITSLTDVPIDPEWDSLREVGINEDSTVSYSLSTQLPARLVLDRVLGKLSTDILNRAGWAVSEGVVRVASQEVLNQDRTLVIYDIQDLLFDIPNFEEVPQIDLQSLLQQSQGGGGGGGQSPFTNDQDNEEGRDPDRPTRQERIDLIRQIITLNVDPEGWIDGGGEVGTIQELNGSLIINNTPANHREIVGLLSKLRQIRSMQINVETKFLLVNQSWFEQIGFDIDVVFNANNNQVRTAQGTNPNVQAGDLFEFGSVGAAGGRRGLQRTFAGGPAAENPTQWSPIGVIQDSLGLANSLVEGDFASGMVAGAPALGISGQFLDDIQVDFLITATQADKRTVQLTAPRLTFTNGQTANIFVVTQQAFVSDLEPIVGDSAVGFDPEVAVASEGVTMLMEGVISSDRRYVTLNVDAGVGRIDGFEQQPVTAVAGGQLVNSADTQSFIQLPTITVTRVRTSVTVPDEGTVMLGGQRLITELEVETGVPVLSKIPIINRFFTNRIESKEEQTLLILLKPTVLIQTEQEEKRFPGLQDSLQNSLR